MHDLRQNEDSRGRLFIFSAPSGTGKTTLCNALRKLFPGLAYSISFTTRAPRENEINGHDYFFISKEKFEKKTESGKWAEWAQVHGNYYGTCSDKLNQHLHAGRNILLDIDVAGAMQIKSRYPDAIAVFIMPPSTETLKKRLESRATDNTEEIRRRIEHAKNEIAKSKFYDHVVINDRLDDALEELAALIRSYAAGM